MKRLFDFGVAFIGLAVALPVLAGLAVIIRATSRGPAIFGQDRVGMHEKTFRLYKLRTMYTGTQQVATHHLGANAVTPVGHFLRRWKLDELPQLFNVLLGSMSIVGPRPCLPTQTELITARRHKGAFAIRPGITGLAQVQGIDMSAPQRLADVDGIYVQGRSFWSDIGLIIRTGIGRGLRLDGVNYGTDRDHEDRK
jgi:O-antigen biosynthesis protein WbqP